VENEKHSILRNDPESDSTVWKMSLCENLRQVNWNSLKLQTCYSLFA